MGTTRAVSRTLPAPARTIAARRSSPHLTCARVVDTCPQHNRVLADLRHVVTRLTPVSSLLRLSVSLVGNLGASSRLLNLNRVGTERAATAGADQLASRGGRHRADPSGVDVCGEVVGIAHPGDLRCSAAPSRVSGSAKSFTGQHVGGSALAGLVADGSAMLVLLSVHGHEIAGRR